VNPGAALRVDNGLLMRNAAVAGLGVALLSSAKIRALTAWLRESFGQPACWDR
jgi:hypothetical protein